MKFNFYDVVKVLSEPSKEMIEISGQEGVVLGRAEEDGCCVYAISLSSGETWQIEEEDLESTGKISAPADIYSGESIKVSVDPETGDGFVEGVTESGKAEHRGRTKLTD